jgi:N-acetylglucosamine malate deacetylase 1
MKKTALVLAPHPDDESITGLLPLRLQEECGFRIQAVPATLGSRTDRRTARKKELRDACAALGFRLRFLGPGDPVARMQALLESIRPAVVFLPHAKDGHPTHRATHRLGVAAMDAIRGSTWAVVETEYWHPLERPNLMVAADEAQVRRLCRALACHAGEIARNDYAARLPAWMIDNVRRGAELVGGAGAAAPEVAYATLYRARIRAGGAWGLPFKGGRLVESSEDLGALARLWA